LLHKRLNQYLFLSPQLPVCCQYAHEKTLCFITFRWKRFKDSKEQKARVYWDFAFSDYSR